MTPLKWAVATFTVIPVGNFDPDRRAAGTAMTLAPLAVLPLAMTVAGMTFLPLPPTVLAVLIVTALAIGTRAMHLDAVADVADALGGGWTPQRAAEILHRGDMGPMGAVALVLCLMAQVAALVHILPADSWAVVGAAVVVSRCAVVITCRHGVRPMPSSRLGALVAESVHPALALAVLAAGTALLALVNPWAVVVALIAWLAVAGLVAVTSHRFGGVNGDVMGAGIELAFTVLLVGWTAL